MAEYIERKALMKFPIGDWNYCPNCGEKMEGGAANASD